MEPTIQCQDCQDVLPEKFFIKFTKKGKIAKRRWKICPMCRLEPDEQPAESSPPPSSEPSVPVPVVEDPQEEDGKEEEEAVEEEIPLQSEPPPLERQTRLQEIGVTPDQLRALLRMLEQ